MWSIWIAVDGEAREMITVNDYATAYFYRSMFSWGPPKPFGYQRTAWIEEGVSNEDVGHDQGSAQHSGADSDCIASHHQQRDSEVSHEQNTENIPAIGLG